MAQTNGIAASRSAVAALSKADFVLDSEGQTYRASLGRFLFEVAYDKSMDSWQAHIYEQSLIRTKLYTHRSSFKYVRKPERSMAHIIDWTTRQPEDMWK